MPNKIIRKLSVSIVGLGILLIVVVVVICSKNVFIKEKQEDHRNSLALNLIEEHKSISEAAASLSVCPRHHNPTESFSMICDFLFFHENVDEQRQGQVIANRIPLSC